ncbi:MAG: 16S rRNA (adenine(1518)-N(6)/adenine(1519)-N(6))-dimethyltransferase RsmA [Xanthomonadales bacterium]
MRTTNVRAHHQAMVKHTARKRFGQNFLTDPMVIQRIVDTIAPQPDELFIEIGPGRGALTIPLINTGIELLLVEIDRDLAARLAAQFRIHPGVHVHTGDALKMDFAAIADNRPFRLVGNLPYNISTPLLFHVLKWSELIRDMHFMLQSEVVKRMAAAPGTKAWGRLSIMCQYLCEIVPLFTVPAESFTPVPKVQSGIVKLIPHRQPPVQIASKETFDRLVIQAFSMRRKTLRNSLRGLLDVSLIESAGIDPGLRAEALGLKQFADLANLME